MKTTKQNYLDSRTPKEKDNEPKGITTCDMKTTKEKIIEILMQKSCSFSDGFKITEGLCIHREIVNEGVSISDNSFRVDFNKDVEELTDQILELIAQDRQEIIEAVERLKKTNNAEEDQSVAERVYYEQQKNIGFNQAIDQAIALIKKL